MSSVSSAVYVSRPCGEGADVQHFSPVEQGGLMPSRDVEVSRTLETRSPASPGDVSARGFCFHMQSLRLPDRG